MAIVVAGGVAGSVGRSAVGGVVDGGAGSTASALIPGGVHDNNERTRTARAAGTSELL